MRRDSDDVPEELLLDDVIEEPEAPAAALLFSGWCPFGLLGGGVLLTAPNGEQIFPEPSAWWAR